MHDDSTGFVVFVCQQHAGYYDSCTTAKTLLYADEVLTEVGKFNARDYTRTLCRFPGCTEPAIGERTVRCALKKTSSQYSLAELDD